MLQPPSSLLKLEIIQDQLQHQDQSQHKDQHLHQQMALQ